MKKEIEYKYLVNLMNSKYCQRGIIDAVKSIFKKESGSKKDFERVAEAPERNKDFDKFFNILLSEGSIEFYEKKTHKFKPCNFYIINYSKMKERLKRNPLWTLTTNLVLVTGKLEE